MARRDRKKTKMGFSEDEQSEASTAQQMKRVEGKKGDIEYENYNRDTNTVDTFDSASGKKEGEIILGSQGATGQLVPLNIIEKTETHYEFNAETDIEEDRKSSGQFKIKNPSSNNKIWDIDIKFVKDKSASIDETLHINTLEPEGEEIIDYEIEEFEEPALKINEFISTQNDEDTLSYSLSIAESNVVLFKITATNNQNYPLNNITINKEVIDGYSNVEVLDKTHGDVDIEGGNIEWKIETLEEGQEAYLKFNMTIEIPDADYKPKTGKVSAEYYAKKALTGIEIDAFDAYSDNFVGMEIEQNDDDPDSYTCNVQFMNESDFRIKLVNLDIVNPANNKKRLDIDPKEIPVLAAGSTWKSVDWVTETENGVEPEFHKTVEFFLVADREIDTLGSITIDDIELAVAKIEGKLDYSITSLPSFIITPFNVLLQVKNTGGADLNELILQETIQNGYIPPTLEEIELYIVRPGDGDDLSAGFDENEEIDWEDLGENLPIPSDMIELTPDDQEPEGEHTLKVKLEELRESPIGMITPGTIIRVKYPIQAHKPARDSEYTSNVLYTANTYPAGAPIEITPATISIPVEHKRKKLMRGKTVRALATEGHYEITLTIKNTGEDALTSLVARDIVPANFEYSDYSQEPTSFENLEGKDMLVWEIEELAANDKIKITYTIKGIGDEFKASDAQFSV